MKAYDEAMRKIDMHLFNGHTDVSTLSIDEFNKQIKASVDNVNAAKDLLLGLLKTV